MSETTTSYSINSALEYGQICLSFLGAPILVKYGNCHMPHLKVTSLYRIWLFSRNALFIFLEGRSSRRATWKEETEQTARLKTPHLVWFVSQFSNHVSVTSAVRNLTSLPLITENDMLLQHIFSKIIHAVQNTQ